MSSNNIDKQEDRGTHKTNWKKEYTHLVQVLENVFDFKRWKLQETFARIEGEAPPYVIYSSEWCRVRFALRGGDMHQALEMSVSYGRLHAPDDDGFVIWNGEKCRAWHRVNEALYFLDRLSSKEAAEKRQVKYELPYVMEQFRQSELGQKVLPGGYQTIEGVARLHAAIWEQYGQHLFELFDLRRPELWDRFIQFLSEYHNLLRTPTIPGFPAPDKNC